MKYYTFLFLSFFYINLNAQCLPDNVNQSIWGNINDYYNGFTIDNDTSTIDTATFFIGQENSVTIQAAFAKRVNIGGAVGSINYTRFELLDIINLPTGLDWIVDSTAIDTANTFYPNFNRFGAITICGSAKEFTGIYEAQLKFESCATLAGITQCITECIPIHFRLLPIQDQFYISSQYICSQANVNFTVINPSLPANSYTWSLGGGNIYTGLTVSNTFNQSTPVSLSFSGNTYWDTVNVYEKPTVTNGIVDSIILCQRDTVCLYFEETFEQIKWFKNNILIECMNDSCLKTTKTDTYYAQVYEKDNPCFAISDTFIIVNESLFPQIVIHIDTINDQLSVANPLNHSIQWYANDALLLNETDTILNIDSAYNHFVCQFSSENGCSSFSDTIVLFYDTIIDSLANNIMKFTDDIVSVKPNPNNGTFIVTFKDIYDSKTEIKILDIMGKVVYYKQLNEYANELMIKENQLNTGQYFIQIQNANIRTVKRFSVIK